MRLVRFGGLYLDPDQLVFARRFLAALKGLRPDDEGGLVVVFEQREMPLYEGDPGFAEILNGPDRNSKHSAR